MLFCLSTPAALLWYAVLSLQCQSSHILHCITWVCHCMTGIVGLLWDVPLGWEFCQQLVVEVMYFLMVLCHYIHLILHNFKWLQVTFLLGHWWTLKLQIAQLVFSSCTPQTSKTSSLCSAPYWVMRSGKGSRKRWVDTYMNMNYTFCFILTCT